MSKASAKKPVRATTGRRDVQIGLYPEDEAHAAYIAASPLAGFPGGRAGKPAIIRKALSEYARICREAEKP